MAFPEDISCEKCTIQLIWLTDNMKQYFCADITLMSEAIKPCIGKCLNGGACYNGKCVCNEGYSGYFCETKLSEATTGVSPWIWIILLLVIIAGLFVGAYFISNLPKPQSASQPFAEEVAVEKAKKHQKEAKRLPLGYEEQKSEPGEDVNMEDLAAKKEEPAKIEEEEQPKESKDDLDQMRMEAHGHEEGGSEHDGKNREELEAPETLTCSNGHALVLSKDGTGYPGGYYMCVVCKKVKKCSQERWNCSKCGYDICADCGKKSQPAVEEKKEEQPESNNEIEQLIESKQIEEVTEYRLEKGENLYEWTNTHFIFAIDCSSNFPLIIIDDRTCSRLNMESSG